MNALLLPTAPTTSVSVSKATAVPNLSLAAPVHTCCCVQLVPSRW